MSRAVLLLGPPGSGKVSSAREMARSLPSPSGDELAECAWIWEGARLGWPAPLQSTGGLAVPFRAPHHTVSERGLIGGWNGSAMPRCHPGEVSLAHRGCLLLDELVEFRKSTIEALSRALREGEVRAWHRGEWTRIPARPALVVATSNLCPCGYLGSSRPCTCKPDRVASWTERLYTLASALGIREVIPCEPWKVAS